MGSSSPYRSHPAYALRLAILANAAIGIGLGIANAFFHYVSYRSILIRHIELFVLSIVVTSYDLVQWAVNTSSGNESYKWPSKLVVLADLLLAVLFLSLYIGEVASLWRYSYRDSVAVFVVYGTIPPLVAIITHILSVWKQMRKISSGWNISLPWSNRRGAIRMEEDPADFRAEA